jgi:hypothetical protein
MRMFIYGYMAIGLSLAFTAEAEVFRCEDPEQGIVFQQTPCAEPEPDEQDEPAENGAGDAAEAAPSGRPRLSEGEDVEKVLATEAELRQEAAQIQACKQRYRDAIDAIDLEIQNSYTPEQREYYLERLKALTEKMSSCER